MSATSCESLKRDNTANCCSLSIPRCALVTPCFCCSLNAPSCVALNPLNCIGLNARICSTVNPPICTTVSVPNFHGSIIPSCDTGIAPICSGVIDVITASNHTPPFTVTFTRSYPICHAGIPFELSLRVKYNTVVPFNAPDPACTVSVPLDCSV